MSRSLLTLSIALSMLSLAACTQATPTIPDDDSSSSSSSVSSMQASVAAASSSSATTADVRVVDVAVTDWSFSPATVTAKKGEKLQLRLKTEEGIHGFFVADLGLNVRLQPGEDVVIDVPTDRAGTFNGRCNIPCGSGHSNMLFTIVVE